MQTFNMLIFAFSSSFFLLTAAEFLFPFLYFLNILRYITFGGSMKVSFFFHTKRYLVWEGASELRRM